MKGGGFGSSVVGFFNSEEGRNLYLNCPYRKYLDHINEIDENFSEFIIYHMLGHILDYRAGELSQSENEESIRAISQEGIEDELRYIFNDLNNVDLAMARQRNPNAMPSDRPEFEGYGPEQKGCFGSDARAELMAEAFRAYMQNPNYLKTVAPRTAQRIRGAVNTNPVLNRIIQFN